MEDCPNKRISIQTKLKIHHPGLNHHTSVQYGASFFSKNPIVRRSSNSEVVHLEKIKKEEIFDLVYRFVGKLVTNSAYIDKIIKDMKYSTEDETISVAKISQNSSQQDSLNSLPSTDAINQESIQSINQSAPKIKVTQPKDQQKRKEARHPKISIMVGSFSDFGSSSGSKFSCNSIVNISYIKFPPHILTLDMIRRIFEEPEAFLINLSLCLMLKFLHYSKIPFTFANACWILSISTIVAYKIYYDDPVGGLIESFAQILDIKTSEIKDLQRYFLDQIKFQAVITSQQYHVMLATIIAP